ncbi:Retrovirus-related Pol polyprotein from transposon 17.6, partial [Mucuna pruriens]
MEEEAQPIRQQQRRLNPTILDVVKKEVIKLLDIRIIYPISNSQCVSPVQVVPMKSGMTVMKNQHRSWYLCRFRTVGESIHIAPKDQHKTIFTCPFGTFAYTRMSFGLCNAPSTFQCCMTSIFSDLLQDCMEVFMDDFTVYADSFDACLENLSKVLTRCIDTNLVLNFEKCHFLVTEGIVLGHLVSNRGIEVDKSKIDIITSLPNPASVWEVRSFLDSTKDLSRISARFPYHCPNCYKRMWTLNLTSLVLRPSRSLRTDLHPPLFFKHPTKSFHSSLCVTRPIRRWESSWARELESATSACDYVCFSNDGPSLVKLHNNRKGAANHLSRIERESDPMPIRDEFSDTQLQHIHTPTPWFEDICNFVAASQFPPETS